jgi:hypothetical protein
MRRETARSCTVRASELGYLHRHGNYLHAVRGPGQLPRWLATTGARCQYLGEPRFRACWSSCRVTSLAFHVCSSADGYRQVLDKSGYLPYHSPSSHRYRRPSRVTLAVRVRAAEEAPTDPGRRMAVTNKTNRRLRRVSDLRFAHRVLVLFWSTSFTLCVACVASQTRYAVPHR